MSSTKCSVQSFIKPIAFETINLSARVFPYAQVSSQLGSTVPGAVEDRTVRRMMPQFSELFESNLRFPLVCDGATILRRERKLFTGKYLQLRINDRVMVVATSDTQPGN
jgi:hypothetical protein